MLQKLSLKQIEEFKKEQISKRKKITEQSLSRLIDFFENGFSNHYIVSYRKDEILNLRERTVSRIKDDFLDFRSLVSRQQRIIETLKEGDAFTFEVEEIILSTYDRFLLEEYFLSIKPDKKTRATNAKQLGLQECSDFIKQQTTEFNAEKKMESFVNPKKGVSTIEIVKQGAFDIIAEEIANNLEQKKEILEYEWEDASLETKAILKEQDDKKYKEFQKYLNFSSKLGFLSPFQALQIFRAQKLKLIRIQIKINDEKHISDLIQRNIKKKGVFEEELKTIMKDAYMRLIKPVIEIELHSRLKKKAQKMALDEIENKSRCIFNSRSISDTVVMGIYPGTESGCKIALLGSDGELLEQRIIFLRQEESKVILTAMLDAFNVGIIAIADDRGFQKCNQFIRNCIVTLNKPPVCFFISKLGAIGYASSQKAEKEFSKVDKPIRRAIFIARQVQRPLEVYANSGYHLFGLQAQNDILNSSIVQQKIEDVLKGVVHFSGVDVNRSSVSILKLVSGLNTKTAEQIVAHRDKNGKIQARSDFYRILGLDASSFKQVAGFLRIYNGANLLDSTSIHPDQYELVEQILSKNKVTLESVMKEPQKLKQIQWEREATKNNKLLIQDLKKKIEWLVFSQSHKISEDYSLKHQNISELKPNQICKAIVVNVTNFGIFIDAGLGEKAFIHISNLNKPSISKLEIIKAKFLEYDEKTNKISFSMNEVNQKIYSSKKQFKVNKKQEKKYNSNKLYTLEELQQKFDDKATLKKNNVKLKVSIKSIMRSGR